MGRGPTYVNPPRTETTHAQGAIQQVPPTAEPMSRKNTRSGRATRTAASIQRDPAVARRLARPTLVLHDDVRGAVAALWRHVEHQVPRGLILIGGGSVLAAAYQHRISTDIDLCIPQHRATELRQITRNDAGWERLFQIPDRTTDWTADGWATCNVAMKIDGIETTLFATAIEGNTGGNRQMVRGTGFGVVEPAEIATGKITGRWTDPFGEIPIRDLYDLAVMRTVDPPALATGLQALTENEAAACARRLRELPENWHERDPKPVIGQRYEIDLTGLAQRLAPAIEARSWHQVPAARKPLPNAHGQTHQRETPEQPER